MFGAHRQQIGGTVQRPGDIGYRAENLQQRAFDAVRTGDPLLPGRLQRRQTGLHQRGIRRRGEADRIARFVIQAGLRQVDYHVAHIFRRSGGGQRDRGAYPDIAADRFRRPRDHDRRRLHGGLGEQLLHRSRGRFGARHTERRRRLTAGGQGLGIALTEITALPAVELAHGGHQSLGQRPAFRQRHAFRQLHRRIVPGKILRLGRGRDGHTSLGGARCRSAVQPREKAVQPRSLRRREWRVVRDQRNWRVDRVHIRPRPARARSARRVRLRNGGWRSFEKFPRARRVVPARRAAKRAPSAAVRQS